MVKVSPYNYLLFDLVWECINDDMSYLTLSMTHLRLMTSISSITVYLGKYHHNEHFYNLDYEIWFEIVLKEHI